jgi:hypothetical protein
MTESVFFRVSSVAAALLLGLGAAARADLPSPRLDRIAPLGAAAGSSAEVEVQGADLEDVKTLRFDHPGFSSEPVPMKERLFKVTVAADVPAGTYDVRTVGRFGVSNPRLFAVSRGITDVAEKEPNNDGAAAQVVQVNSAVNGISDGNDQDLFKVPLKKGQRVTIDCQAQRLMPAWLCYHPPVRSSPPAATTLAAIRSSTSSLPRREIISSSPAISPSAAGFPIDWSSATGRKSRMSFPARCNWVRTPN